MKTLNIILEIITAPFVFLFKACGSSNKSLNMLSKTIVLFLIAVIITVLLVLFFYRTEIFK